MNLHELSEKLKSGEAITPEQLSKIRLELSGWLAYFSEQLIDILKIKPEKWLEYRKQAKSSAEADKLWDASEEGKKEMELKLKIKVIEKIMSSIRLRLDVMNKEAQNYY